MTRVRPQHTVGTQEMGPNLSASSSLSPSFPSFLPCERCLKEAGGIILRRAEGLVGADGGLGILEAEAGGSGPCKGDNGIQVPPIPKY